MAEGGEEGEVVVAFGLGGGVLPVDWVSRVKLFFCRTPAQRGGFCKAYCLLHRGRRNLRVAAR